MKIWLDKDVLNSNDLTVKGKMVYTALRKIKKRDESIYIINHELIIFELYGNLEYTYSFKYIVETGLKELVDCGLVLPVGENIYNLKKLDLDLKDNNFVAIDNSELRLIINKAPSYSRMKILLYFLILIDSINQKDYKMECYGSFILKHTGNVKQDILATRANISRTTLREYNKVLEDLNLIYVYRCDTYIITDEYIFSFSNVYGRYRHKEQVIKCANGLLLHYKNNGFKTSAKRKTKEEDGLIQRFVRVKKGKTYSYDEMEEIYTYYYNENQKRDYTKSQDLTMFKDYDFYIPEETPTASTT